MERTYLSYNVHCFFAFLIFILWIIESSFALLLAILAYGIFLFFFRKYKSVYHEDAAIKKGMIYSPVNGRVISIKKGVDHAFFGKNLSEFRILIPWWKEFGLYLPSKSEVIDLVVERGKSFYRFCKTELPSQEVQMAPSLAILLRGVEGDFLGMQLIKCPLGLWPEVSVIPGDRGKCQVSVGHFPLGGTVLLYLPSKYEILVDSDQEAMAGLTIIAGLPGVS